MLRSVWRLKTCQQDVRGGMVPLTIVKKTAFWENLHNFGNIGSQPWVIIGDLNEICWESEKEGGSEWHANRRRFLLDFMDHLGLVDLGFVGQDFTWELRIGNVIHLRERFDRGMSNLQ
ncbi:hypothetical protein ACE6H2_014560 [Prunus campanulata]